MKLWMVNEQNLLVKMYYTFEQSHVVIFWIVKIIKRENFAKIYITQIVK